MVATFVVNVNPSPRVEVTATFPVNVNPINRAKVTVLHEATAFTMIVVKRAREDPASMSGPKETTLQNRNGKEPNDTSPRLAAPVWPTGESVTTKRYSGHRV